MDRKQVSNFPVQGSAFHCLLWCLIQIQKQFTRRKLRTRIIGQIHDSLILDIVSKEVETVYQIVNLFKRYSLPKRIGGLAGRFVEYPAEFRIRFNHDGLENLYLPRIGRCSLTDINVVYGDEVFSTFAPVSAQTQRGETVGGAAPTKIEMTLSFTELEILS